MSDLVDPNTIEQIVGRPRHPTWHYGRDNTKNNTFYIMHSQECVDSGIDLRECEYSLALDREIDEMWWKPYPDRPVKLGISNGLLVPEGG